MYCIRAVILSTRTVPYFIYCLLLKYIYGDLLYSFQLGLSDASNAGFQHTIGHNALSFGALLELNWRIVEYERIQWWHMNSFQTILK